VQDCCEPDPPAARKLLVLLELASAEVNCLITSHDAGCSCRLCRESGRAFWLLRTLQSKLMPTVRLTLLEQAGPLGRDGSPRRLVWRQPVKGGSRGG
jgi:hypothetical protein